MTTTDRHEEANVEAAMHHEGTEGYVEGKLAAIALAHARVEEIHTQMRDLNQELGQLQNDVWGWQCDIQAVQ